MAQTIKPNENKIVITVSPKYLMSWCRKLKEAGYIIKGQKDQADYKIEIDHEENAVIILKYDKEWKNPSERVWPPPGIEYTKVPKNHSW